MTDTTNEPWLFRLFDFQVTNEVRTDTSSESGGTSASDDGKAHPRRDTRSFLIQMFGLNERGETASVLVDGFTPFFFVKVADHWTASTCRAFADFLEAKLGDYYEGCLTKCERVERKKLYGFDAGKQHAFLYLAFSNMNAFHKAKNIWYRTVRMDGGGSSSSSSHRKAAGSRNEEEDWNAIADDEDEGPKSEKRLIKNGIRFANTDVLLYESHLPPLLRFFHLQDISPSGWVCLPQKKTLRLVGDECRTTCTYEFRMDFRDIVPLNQKETRVPYKICSFDIEASSSHGDFPVPIKSYKKLANDLVELWEARAPERTEAAAWLRHVVRAAFLNTPDPHGCVCGGAGTCQRIDKVYPKEPLEESQWEHRYAAWVQASVAGAATGATGADESTEGLAVLTLESMFEKAARVVQDEDDDVEAHEDTEAAMAQQQQQQHDTHRKGTMTILDLLGDTKRRRDEKQRLCNRSLCRHFPRLEGDKVTFVGSSFLRYGEKEPYKQHCVVLGSCTSPVEVATTMEVESYDTEREVLLAWRDLIQRENPDIIIGYNIFGFDYEFLFLRAQENHCESEFLCLSRNKDEVCARFDRDTGRYKLQESSIHIASGQHDLKFIPMTGRMQVDLYNFFRREENLTSYKLDYVAGYFIGDTVKKWVVRDGAGEATTELHSQNLTGLTVGCYIHLEEIGHTTETYQQGAKFLVRDILPPPATGVFVIQGQVSPDSTKKVRWCLAKDDVSPKDIFEMTRGSAADRGVIAKYCLQDCNLVHYLMNKVDLLTGFVEMAKICSVPMNFLVMRGQGIKLTSFIAKQCREKGFLMPVIEKGAMDEGYEGAIVLEPKCDLYLDNPVACVDYASLYPSSMISENLSHDSKVWTQEYDLAGNLVSETGERDTVDGHFLYDNLPGYEYVDIAYDTYKYVRKTPSAAAEKVISGKKVCRFAQFPQGKAIMPSILEELLQARKATRKRMATETDEFMKNVLDKRQLGYKVTANSLYGQCGAKTSTFYEKDIAACTTATGRLLLTYAKRVVEECYGNRICQTTSHGPVLTKAEYIYGDSVAGYTPVYVRDFGSADVRICSIEDVASLFGAIPGVWTQRDDKEYCEIRAGVETWSEQGWTPLYRVIRHVLAPHKNMVRVLTHTGCVDVTDDHSLLLPCGTEVSPKDVTVGMELLHHSLPTVASVAVPPSFRKEVLQCGDEGRCFWFQDAVEAAQHTLWAQNLGFFTMVFLSFGEYVVTVWKRTSEAATQSSWEKQSIRSLWVLPRPNPETPETLVYDLTTANHHFAAGIGNLVVHNTDSVFFTFHLASPVDGRPIRGKDALEITIELAQEAGHLASSFLKAPHDLEYEKTFMPFCLLSKKRYVGMLYETDPTKCKRKEMGIVLKRRDNAPIVKDVYGGIIDILMKEQNIEKAVDYLKSSLKELVDERTPMEKLIITKSLRSGYKNPQSIAHKVLADRMTERDPGNKPSSGDRIPYVYIQNKNKKALQGEKIETPQYVRDHHLKIDYTFYITNQIMKPVQQVFALVIERIWKSQNKLAKLKRFESEVEQLRRDTAGDEEAFRDKLEKKKNLEVKSLLFDEFLRQTENARAGHASLTTFFRPASTVL